MFSTLISEEISVLGFRGRDDKNLAKGHHKVTSFRAELLPYALA
jgi:hypothetical protein